MQRDSLGKIVLGLYFIMMGLIMIIFHKELKQQNEQWYEHLPWVNRLRPTGRLLTVTIILFGAISILGGIVLILLATVDSE